MCDRGREKGVAIGERGLGVGLEIITDPSGNKWILLQKILRNYDNKEAQPRHSIQRREMGRGT